MDRLTADLVRRNLPTDVFGQNVISVDQTGSTNTELKTLADQGAPEGTLYLANEQVAGRGRLNRAWVAPVGSGLLFSLLFRPVNVVPPPQAQRLTMLCALAMADAIQAQIGVIALLKWPNDLLWRDGKKLAGILTELDIADNRLAWAIVGIGLNVNVDFTTAPFSAPPTGRPGSDGPPLAAIATSLSMILGRDTSADRLPILQKFLFNVEQRYEALKNGQLPHSEWAARLAGIGQSVTVTGADKTYHGLMLGVNKDGALLLKQANGVIETILAGDVTLRH
jgi:BirA family biotin operon repressor/biotin-[acetyl-CoA-carboxylase] ligase